MASLVCGDCVNYPQLDKSLHVENIVSSTPYRLSQNRTWVNLLHPRRGKPCGQCTKLQPKHVPSLGSFTVPAVPAQPGGREDYTDNASATGTGV